jgi:hypothetical protein
MNKLILILTILMFWASPVVAQQAAGSKAAETTESTDLGVPFEGKIDLGYRSITDTGSTKAGEYEYLKPGAIGSLDLEWDPLPHRFVLESTYLNTKDYFGELDYAYKDLVLVNGYMRDVFHNLDHLRFGVDDPATPSPSFTDLNPNDLYGIENLFRRAFLRLKAPDFPFHVYAEVRTTDREGNVQQRYLRELSGGLALVSKSRTIDWNTKEVRVGANSHLGPVEVDYSHTDKKFEAIEEKVLIDTYTAGLNSFSVPHNAVPDLKSSWDTLKVHTTYSGKVVLSGTYSNGDVKNKDSAASTKFTNTAGDLTFMPVTSTLFTLRYRHYDLDLTNPATVNNIVAPGTPIPVSVRDSISSSRDVVIGSLRYRATDRLTLRGEYGTDTTDRTRGLTGSTLPPPPPDNPAFWLVPASTTKTTAKLGMTYRIMNKMTFRADYTAVSVDNPAYATDPDKSSTSRASLVWMPLTWFNTLLSYSIVDEKRDQLGAPLGGGSRDAQHDQGLASMTFLVGKRSSITASYSHFQNKVDQTVTVQDDTGAFALDGGVPYNDVANVGTLSATVAPVNGVNITASGSKSYSRGSFQLSAPNTAGIAPLSDLRVVDSVYMAGVELQSSRNLGCEIRYEYRNYDDQIDNTQDGRVKTVLGTLSMKW